MTTSDETYWISVKLEASAEIDTGMPAHDGQDSYRVAGIVREPDFLIVLLERIS